MFQLDHFTQLRLILLKQIIADFATTSQPIDGVGITNGAINSLTTYIIPRQLWFDQGTWQSKSFQIIFLNKNWMKFEGVISVKWKPMFTD